jgi:sterol desaturase/sphingolipid hydroxylase (fatty acid hydroxylase superfamily)
VEVWDVLNLKALLIAALIFVPLERVATLYKDQKILRKHWKNDLVYAVINKIIIKAALISIFAVFLDLAQRLVPDFVHEFILTQPLWLQVIEVLIVADTGFYLAHRAFHAFPVLWRFHKIHHGIEELDWLAAHRVHPLDQTLTMTASLLPVFALGFSGPAIIVYAFIYQWQSLLIHSNVKVPFGPLKWVLASPQFHHWHHGNEPEAYNRNFAGQLPFIDLLFGTLHLPKREMPKKYGIDEELPPYYHQQLIYPFLRKPRREKTPDSEIEHARMEVQ